MQSLIRREIIYSSRSIVVKIGTNVLSTEDGRLDTDHIRVLVRQFRAILAAGKKLAVVTSGAVGAGMDRLGLVTRPTSLPELQAAAASGQSHLIRLYDEALQEQGLHAGQLLLTADDFKHRDRFLNMRNTIRALQGFSCVPIINENDTISVDEIRFSDNDALAAMVTHLLDDPLLIILSVVDGLYDRDPNDPGRQVIPLVERWSDEVLEKAFATKSSRGKGGMGSKLSSIRNATAVGDHVILANGKTPDILTKIVSGEEIGTLFMADDRSVTAWKRWIGFTVEPRGRLMVDAGARRALEQNGKSLLPIGVVNVVSDFGVGELVGVVDPQGMEFARGLTNFDSNTVRQLAGLKSDAVIERLGSASYAEVIHRDNLVLTK